MNPVGEHSAMLIEALVRSGVRHAVVSPGSRSTPLVHAALTHPELETTDVIDERSAAFYALGRARITGMPSLLICTSGTAPAHYYPAVIEACEARLPLLVLSADRPAHLYGSGANQTVDQVKLYGDRVRFFADLDPPDLRADSLRALRRIAVEALRAALHPEPGPVHLNARFEKPLEPGPARGGVEREAEEVARRVAAEPLPSVHVPRRAPDPAGVDALVSACADARDGIIACGPAPLASAEARAAVFELARRTGFALLPEATSQLRFAPRPDGVAVIDLFDPVLATASGRTRARPDLVIQIGRAPTSSAWDRFVRERGAAGARVCLSEHGRQDPWGTATAHVEGDVAAILGAALEHIAERTPARLVEDLLAAGRVASVACAAVIAGTSELSEAEVARATVAALPDDSLLMLGNSLPVRMVDRWVPGGGRALGVLCQRGASGIDGLVSGAAGAASASGRPLALLVGDVSFLHDLGGLAAMRSIQSPVLIVVVDNGGGRIFEQLPIADASPAEALSHWTTPPGLSIEHAARAFGFAHARVDARKALDEAIVGALRRPGCTVVEATVPPHGAREDTRHVVARIEEALEELWS